MLVINNSSYFISSTLYLSATSTDELNDLCPNSCTEISYETMSRSIPHDLSDMTLISIYYQSGHLCLFEEYLVFDLTSILVPIRGSLGLYLGFSFFQCDTGFCSKTIAFTRRLFEKKHCNQTQPQAVLQC